MPIQYDDPSLDVPPGVDFLDAAQTAAWVAACEVDKPWRVPVRERFAALIAELPSSARILELGSGPGLLAETILESCSNVESYTLLDFSPHMLELSQQRLSRFPMCRFVEANFRRRDWHTLVSGKFTAIVAMQAVHEIRHKRHVPGLYRELAALLAPSGLLAVCDGIPRDPSVLWQVNLCMTAEEQLEAFAVAGLTDARVEMVFEKLLVMAKRSGEQCQFPASD